jgi:hypothetical protein
MTREWHRKQSATTDEDLSTEQETSCDELSPPAELSRPVVEVLPDRPNPDLISRDGDGRRPVEAAIASALLPWPYDDSKSLYLSFRACGMSVREALKLTGNAESTLSFWRKNADFLKAEQDIPKIRRRLANEYVEIEFVRNFRLILEKDYRIIYKSLHPTIDEESGLELPMSPQDFDYLSKIRTQYSPQQLSALNQILSKQDGKDSDGKDVNWTKIFSDNPDLIPGREVELTQTVKVKQN